MGNVQASSIANQILPFEYYIADVPELKYIHSLGSTRFLKVARAESSDGSVVVKVFVLVDQSLSLDPYKEQIYQIRKRTIGHPNLCPFRRVHITPRCAIISRPYQRFTLYERLSTRPFLLEVEKLWIAFQLLKGLAQCRIAMVNHGDIKAENVLISSSLWAQLTDFASFKPAFIPYDNPSLFTFFFDSSRRRCCTLAPERFKKSDEINYSTRLPGDFLNISDGLTEAMDIFGMGCVILELLTDGRQIAFTLPQAIDYKRMDEHSSRLYLKKILAEVPNGFRELLTIMLDRNPSRRKEEFVKLSPCSSSLFPPLFEKYFYRYLKEFQAPPMQPDYVITKLFVEQSNYIGQLEAGERDSVILFIDLITTNLRACLQLTAKMDALSLLHRLSTLASASVVADRIVPYIVNLFGDPLPQVRAESICVLTEMLGKLAGIGVPQDEWRLLVDFVFPKLKVLTADGSIHVKCSLASNLGRLAITSLKFFEEGSKNLQSEATLMTPTASTAPTRAASPTQAEVEATARADMEMLIRSERSALQDSVNDLFVNLCSSENEVRKSLFAPTNLDLLCLFFGKGRAIDVLMHIVTLLNDKPDWRMRAMFFTSCHVVARYLGQNRNAKLEQFLQQGLQDCEEYVVLETLRCFHRLCDENLLQKPIICDLLRDVVPFLVHPDKWLRVAAVNVLTVLDSTFSISDIYCKLSPLIRPFFREQLIRLNDRSVVYQCLCPPIPRQIWDFVVEFGMALELLSTLENRRTLEKLGGGRNSLFSAAASAPQKGSSGIATVRESPVEVAVRKLANLGLTEEVEDQLLAFKGLISRMVKFRRILGSPPMGSRTSTLSAAIAEMAHVHLNDLPKVNRKIFDLEKGVHRIGQSKSTADWKEVLGESDFTGGGGGANVNGGGGGRDHDSLGSVCSASELLPLDVAIHHPSSSAAAAAAKELGDPQSFRSTARFQLEETLSHKLKRYQTQKRINASTNNMHADIAERIAAAVMDGTADERRAAAGAMANNGGHYLLDNTSSASFQQPSTSSASFSCVNGTSRVEIKLLAHMQEHAEPITQ